MKNISKKHWIIGAVFCAVLLIVASVAWVKVYEQHKIEKNYNNYKAKIEELENKFGEDTERSEKIEVLKTVINDSEKYSDTDKPDERIIQEYDITIKAMRTYFIKGYDAVIEKYAYGNRAQGEDSLYEEEIESLSDELKLIEEEKGIVSTEEEVEAYKKKIGSSISKYEAMAKENAENMLEEQPSEVESQITKEEAFQLIIDNVEFTYDIAESQGWEETPSEHMYNSDATWGWWYSVQSIVTDVEVTIIDNDTIYVVVMVQHPSSSYEPAIEGEYTLKRGQNSSAGQQEYIEYSGIFAPEGATGYAVPDRWIPFEPSDAVIHRIEFEETQILVWGTLNAKNTQGEIEKIKVEGKVFKIGEGCTNNQSPLTKNIMDSWKRIYNGNDAPGGGGITLEVQSDIVYNIVTAG